MSKLIVSNRKLVCCSACKRQFEDQDEDLYFCRKHKKIFCKHCLLSNKCRCEARTSLNYFHNHFHEESATCTFNKITEVDSREKND